MTTVLQDRIVFEQEAILLSEIVSLEKQSKESPANPCSPQIPLGCSVPDWVTWLHESQRRYRDYFYPSCEQHDYCYRHGAATYGKTRVDCDTEFLEDMREQCSSDDWTDFLLKIQANPVECNAVASEFYSAVQLKGADRFVAQGGTRCEYDGPP